MLEYDHVEQAFYAAVYAIIIIFALILRKYLKNKDEDTRFIPLNIIGIFLVILEIFKQVKNLVGYDTTSFWSFIAEDYDTFSGYALPFHFCSFFIFFLIGSLVSKGKLKYFFRNMTFLWSTFIAIFIFFYPCSIMGGAVNSLAESGVLQHTVVFHATAFAYFVYAIALNTVHFEKKEFWYAPMAFIIYACLAIPFAWIFDANYCSIVYPDFFAFLVPIFDASVVLYEAVLVTIGVVLSIGIYFAIYGVTKLTEKIKNSKLVNYGFLGFAIVLFPLSFLFRYLNNSGILGNNMYIPWMVVILLICMIPAVVATIMKKDIKED